MDDGDDDGAGATTPLPAHRASPFLQHLAEVALSMVRLKWAPHAVVELGEAGDTQAVSDARLKLKEATAEYVELAAVVGLALAVHASQQCVF